MAICPPRLNNCFHDDTSGSGCEPGDLRVERLIRAPEAEAAFRVVEVDDNPFGPLPRVHSSLVDQVKEHDVVAQAEQREVNAREDRPELQAVGKDHHQQVLPGPGYSVEKHGGPVRTVGERQIRGQVSA